MGQNGFVSDGRRSDDAVRSGHRRARSSHREVYLCSFSPDLFIDREIVRGSQVTLQAIEFLRRFRPSKKLANDQPARRNAILVQQPIDSSAYVLNPISSKGKDPRGGVNKDPGFSAHGDAEAAPEDL